MNGTISARYFDGRHSQSHAVTLAIAADRVVVTGETVARDEPVDTVTISVELGRASRLLQFADGALCEVTDHEALRNLLARHGLGRRRLSRWQQGRTTVLVCVAAVVIGGLWVYVFG